MSTERETKAGFWPLMIKGLFQGLMTLKDVPYNKFRGPQG